LANYNRVIAMVARNGDLIFQLSRRVENIGGKELVLKNKDCAAPFKSTSNKAPNLFFVATGGRQPFR